MNQIIIKSNYCSREEYQELKDYLTEKCWDWQEVSSEVKSDIFVTQILQHNIEWSCEGDCNKLLDIEQEHIQYMIEQGFSSGELTIGIEEVRGWWKIVK